MRFVTLNGTDGEEESEALESSSDPRQSGPPRRLSGFTEDASSTDDMLLVRTESASRRLSRVSLQSGVRPRGPSLVVAQPQAADPTPQPSSVRASRGPSMSRAEAEARSRAASSASLGRARAVIATDHTTVSTFPAPSQSAMLSSSVPSVLAAEQTMRVVTAPSDGNLSASMGFAPESSSPVARPAPIQTLSAPLPTALSERLIESPSSSVNMQAKVYLHISVGFQPVLMDRCLGPGQRTSPKAPSTAWSVRGRSTRWSGWPPSEPSITR